MAFVTVETFDGPKKVRVCDYCKTVCIPSGRFCSSRCYWQNEEREIEEAKREKEIEK
jgi:hypothetical protein